MSLRVEYHPEALAELEADALWYEEREVGLGYGLFDEVTRVAIDAAETPGVWPLFPDVRVELEVRRRVLRRFPYVLAFKLVGDALVVIAVAHARRKPGYWLHRL
ncbi:MAG: type II toxin-antitoxin system RelE/ParE family toxin [Alphaproteobacteria bacterium]|nr:type II toxin-antitoxin system RelE/ParE family toxin [Alphaproteobacteria bacterium]